MLKQNTNTGHMNVLRKLCCPLCFCYDELTIKDRNVNGKEKGKASTITV